MRFHRLARRYCLIHLSGHLPRGSNHRKGMRDGGSWWVMKESRNSRCQGTFSGLFVRRAPEHVPQWNFLIWPTISCAGCHPTYELWINSLGANLADLILGLVALAWN